MGVATANLIGRGRTAQRPNQGTQVDGGQLHTFFGGNWFSVTLSRTAGLAATCRCSGSGMAFATRVQSEDVGFWSCEGSNPTHPNQLM